MGARHLDVQRRGHAGLQAQVGVVNVDHRRVGDDVLRDYRLNPDLPDEPREFVLGIGVNREGDVLPGVNHADVGFVDARVQLHLGEIAGDDEQRRRLEAGRDGLADVHAPGNDDPVDRRGDDRVLPVDDHLVERGAGLRLLRAGRPEVGVRRLQGDLGRVVIGVRDELPVVKRGRLFELHFGVPHGHHGSLGIGSGFAECRTGRLDLGVEERWVEPRDYLALVHDAVEVGSQLADGARHLRAYLRRDNRLERTGGGHATHDVARGCEGGLKVRRRRVAVHASVCSHQDHGGQCDANRGASSYHDSLQVRSFGLPLTWIDASRHGARVNPM